MKIIHYSVLDSLFQDAAPIFLWDTITHKRLAVLRGLTVKVTQIAFSDDEQFICGCDAVRF